MNAHLLSWYIVRLHQDIFPNASVMHPPKFSVYYVYIIFYCLDIYQTYYIHHIIDTGIAITPRNLPVSPANYCILKGMPLHAESCSTLLHQPAANGKEDIAYAMSALPFADDQDIHGRGQYNYDQSVCRAPSWVGLKVVSLSSAQHRQCRNP